MATTLEFSTPDVQSPMPHRWTLEEYLRIQQAGVLGEGVRTELIEGQIYVKMGQGNAHIIAIQLVFRALQMQFGPGYHLAMSLPMPIGEDNPEPDVRVLKGAIEDYDGQSIDPVRDVALVVEVSDSTLAFDQKTKARLYATHGIAEYWIVNLRERTLEIRRKPDSEHGEYAELRILREGDTVSVSEGSITVRDLLPKP